MSIEWGSVPQYLPLVGLIGFLLLVYWPHKEGDK